MKHFFKTCLRNDREGTCKAKHLRIKIFFFNHVVSLKCLEFSKDEIGVYLLKNFHFKKKLFGDLVSKFDISFDHENEKLFFCYHTLVIDLK